jgi:hypothetical protein
MVKKCMKTILLFIKLQPRIWTVLPPDFQLTFELVNDEI